MANVVGIDASRNHSGGAIAHIIGILNGANPQDFGIDSVHLWTYKALADKIPNYPWLTKHIPKALSKSMLHKLYWQYFHLPKEVKQAKCNILFNTDAGSICPFQPSITMSQDLLSFEPNEMRRYGISKHRLRLIILKFIQTKSLTNSDVSIYLTKYAQNIIQKTLKTNTSVVISHGIDKKFHQDIAIEKLFFDQTKSVQCLYVSNADLYKHQWHVIEAIAKLRKANINATLLLVGGGSGLAQKKLEKQLKISDPHNTFTKQLEFVPHERIPQLLANTNIFIFASSCESLPITLLEAMASGLPIASSNRGPMPEVLQNGGIYFNPECKDSIALAITTIINDQDLRIKLAKNAQLLSKQYTWEECSKQTWMLLNKTIQTAEVDI